MALHTSGLTRDLEVLELLGSDSSWEQGGLGVQEISARLAGIRVKSRGCVRRCRRQG